MNLFGAALPIFRRHRPRLLFWLAIPFLATWQTSDRAMGQDLPQFVARVWRTDDGLPQISVKAIAQTRDGYLWFGTVEGLARFDGVRFTLWDAVPAAIKTRWFTTLCGSTDGSLWIGTASGGVVHLQGGKSTHYTRRNGLAGDDIRAICEDHDGSIWIGTTEGLSRFADGKFTNFTPKDGLNHRVVRALSMDRQSRLWIVAGDAGLNRFENGRIIDPFPNELILPSNSLRTICEDSQGNFWFGGDFGLIKEHEGKRVIYNKKDGLSDNFVSALCEDRHGNLWVGTPSGLNRFVDGKFRIELKSDGTPWDPVNTIFEDREGHIWVGTIDGLCRLTTRQFTVYSKQEGLSYNDVMSLCEDRRGNFWICTWGGGLNQLKNGKVRATAFHEGLFDKILSVCEDHAGNIWVGCDHQGGLFRITLGTAATDNPHGFTDAAQHWSVFTTTNGFTNSAIKVIYEDRQTNLWVATGISLARYKDGKFIHYTEKDGLTGNVVQALCEDHEGNLLIGTSKGLASYKDGVFTSISGTNRLASGINAIFQDSEGTVWIGTSGGGLNKLQNKSEFPITHHASRITSYTTKHGLFTDSIYEILDDDFGNLWMSSRKGIFRVSKKNLDDFDQKRVASITCVAYSQVDGGTSIIGHGVAKPAAWKAGDGRLWFATAKGIVGFSPGTLVNPDKMPPPITIEEVIADKRIVTSGEWRMTGGPLHAAPVIIPPGRGELEFHYTALAFRAPEKNRFKYKLQDVDSDWENADTRRVAYYNNLKPGHYTFQVVGCNSDGIWNESGATLKLTLQPHYWQTWWFKSLCAVGTLCFTAATARSITRRRMQQKLERLQQQHVIEKERARIAQDMHDDLGANLTQIALLSELAQRQAENPQQVRYQTGRIAETSRHLVQALDEIVWAVNPRNDNLADFITYVCQFAENFLESSPVRFRLERPATVPAVPLSADLRHNLFLIVKEALNNIVKHADAAEVWLRVKLASGTLEINVEDNGCGFSSGHASPFSDGLLNMRKRIENLGGQFEASSAPGAGTKIKCLIRFEEMKTPPPKR